jgi:hypothetical protein
MMLSQPANLIIHTQSLTHRFRTSRSDVPGALAILCAIAFATGVVDEDVREMLAPVLWGTLFGTVVFGLIYWQVRRTRQHPLVVFRSHGECSVSIAGPAIREEFGPGFSWRHGVYIEHIDAYVADRDAPVAWVQLRSADGRTLTVRKALGVQHAVPAWPETKYDENSQRVFSGDPLPLFSALTAANAPTPFKSP